MKSKLQKRRRYLRWLLLTVVVLGAYPAFVFASVYSKWFASDFPGGRNGPADAYRHSLASATVAYTGSPRFVDWVTAVMERDGLGSESRAMDAHNNRIGTRIGLNAASWNDIQDAVLHAVKSGDIDAVDFNQITWLPPERWQNRLY